MATANLEKSEALTESVHEAASNWGGLDLKVDREKGIIPGVKVLGLESINRRSYKPDALRTGAGMYEGARVYVNHAAKGTESRNYQDLLGTIRGAHYREGQGVFGDLHYNPKHAVAEQLAWDAENAPNSAGFSPHHFYRYSRGQEGRIVIEEIQKVFSVDLVAHPATTKGFRESIEEPVMSELSTMSVEQVITARPDVETFVASKIKGSQEAQEAASRMALLEAENKALKAAEADRIRRDAVDAKLKEAGIEAVLDGGIRDVAYGLEDAQLDKYIASLQGIAARAPKAPASQKPKSSEQATEAYQPAPEGKRRWN